MKNIRRIVYNKTRKIPILIIILISKFMYYYFTCFILNVNDYRLNNILNGTYSNQNKPRFLFIIVSRLKHLYDRSTWYYC